MARVLCPYCCKVHDFSKSLECPTFHWNVPLPFVRDYDSIPPLWLMTFGFKAYGKTTYLAALTLLLERMDNVFLNMSSESLDDETYEALRVMRAANTRVPVSTPTGPLRPLLFQVRDFGDLGSRSLILHDLAGEHVESPGKMGESASALRRIDTVWFLVSLFNLQKDEKRRTIAELLQVYLRQMRELKIDVRGTNLVVVYSKADEPGFPEDLREYLGSDLLTAVARGDRLDHDVTFDAGEYLREMKRISDRLQEFTWTGGVENGRSFINRARNEGINLVFSMVSALGERPTGGEMGHEKSPRRVIDPFLWALTLQGERTSKSLRLVLDALPPENSMPETYSSDLWSRLTEHGEVTTHILGQARPVSGPGQAPPAPRAGGRSRPRLVGPILQTCSPEERLLVLTDGPILDLADFRDSEWSRRLLLAGTREEIPLDWDQFETFRSNDDIGFLVNRLLSL